MGIYWAIIFVNSFIIAAVINFLTIASNKLHCFLDLGNRQQVEVDDAVKDYNGTKKPVVIDNVSSDTKGRETETSRIQIGITGMSCSSCVNKIESSLSSKKGT